MAVFCSPAALSSDSPFQESDPGPFGTLDAGWFDIKSVLSVFCFSLLVDAALPLKDAELKETILQLLNDKNTLPEIKCNTLTLIKTIYTAGIQSTLFHIVELIYSLYNFIWTESLDFPFNQKKHKHVPLSFFS